MTSSLKEQKLMTPNDMIQGDRVFLRLAIPADCTERYLAWLSDPLVNRYLETRWKPQSMESIRDFVTVMLEDPDNYLFAISETSTGQHIGNIKLGPINRYHSYADVSYFIGERFTWGKGYATEAIQLVTQFAFEKLNLHQLQAGLYASNKGSGRALEKAGYQMEAVFKKQLRFGLSWEDHLWYTIVRKDELQ